MSVGVWIILLLPRGLWTKFVTMSSVTNASDLTIAQVLYSLLCDFFKKMFLPVTENKKKIRQFSSKTPYAQLEQNRRFSCS